MAKAQVFHAVGKRKSAVARVYVRPGNGKVTINERDFVHYFPLHYRPLITRAFEVANLPTAKFDINVNAIGGGVSAQADATMYGIAKALILLDPDLRPALKKAELLTRDSRVVERKKYGHKKARKSFQFSKR